MISKKILFTLLSVFLFLVASSNFAAAREKDSAFHLIYGTEWGLNVNLLYYYHVNYSAPHTGSRVDVSETQFSLHANGIMSAFVGTEIGPKWSAELIGGYMGLYDRSCSFPISLRVTCFPNDRGHGRIKLFAEGGSAFGPVFAGQAPFLFRAGTGTRLELSHTVSMDLSAALQVYLNHPDSIWDDINKTNVDASMMKKCDAIYCGISLLMSVNFR